MRNLFFFMLSISGLPVLIRRFFQKKTVTVLLYHNTRVDCFESHLKYLTARYTPITLSEFRAYMLYGNKLPEFPLLITFDDGHQGNYELLQLFKKYKIRPVIFLVSGIINTEERFWWMGIESKSTLKRMKKLPNPERKEILKSQRKNKAVFPRALNRDEIEEMKPYVDFECHTANHPILTQCNHNEIMIELNESREILESDYGLKITSIAYPNGNWNEQVLKLTAECGYEFGFSLIPGFNRRKTKRLLIHRFSATDNSGIHELSVKSCGLFWFLKIY